MVVRFIESNLMCRDIFENASSTPSTSILFLSFSLSLSSWSSWFSRRDLNQFAARPRQSPPPLIQERDDGGIKRSLLKISFGETPLPPLSNPSFLTGKIARRKFQLVFSCRFPGPFPQSVAPTVALFFF